MDNLVEVSIRYIGYYKKLAKKQTEQFLAQPDLAFTFERLKTHLTKVHGIQPPYNVLVNGKNVTFAINSGMKLNGGEVFSVMPHISGG